MITARLLTVLAASSLAGIASAQTQPTPSPRPSAAPGYNTAKPHQRQMTTVESKSNEEASPKARPAPGSALSSAQSGAPNGALRTAKAGGYTWSNMPVESPSGQSLGSVSQLVPGLNGQRTSGYVLVAGADNMSVPVPYRTASSMVRDGKLVLNQSRLQHAPKIAPEDMQNSADHSWRVKADQYWMHKAQRHTQQ